MFLKIPGGVILRFLPWSWACFVYFKRVTTVRSYNPKIVSKADSSDVVETAIFETETWVKLRDRDFIKNSEIEIRDLKFKDGHSRLQNLWILPNFFLNAVITSKLIFFEFLALFRLF